ncbi:glycogen synthase [Tautonia sociabilis]|uniref:Glycogen synthase n=1 Tax=Tautonia sociabilis TaxID=2080755 RepID=A0A432MJK7_9BACT|nr:glycogen synthase [Tautonia sociabilis]RUL87365.1 glycogen synthase [Tautonia sociabilis]
MRIAILTNEYPPHIYGGAGVHVEYLTRALTEVEPGLHTVQVLCFGDQDLQKGNLTVRGIEPDFPLPYQDPRHKKFKETLLRNLIMAGMLEDVDIVHCHTWYTHLAGCLVKQLAGAKLVLTTHSLEPHRPWKREQLGTAYDASTWIERTAYQNADGVVAVSESMKADVHELYKVPFEKIRVIHNGIDLDQYRPTIEPAVLDRYGIDRSRPFVLFVGRITRQKGIIHLVDAIKHLRTDCQVVLCAGAPDTEEIGREMAEHVEKARSEAKTPILWIPKVLPKPEIIALYSQAAVFVCPSVYEPFGIINLEAMACGTPVVASSVGGIKEVVIPERTGLLVPFEPRGEGDPHPHEPKDPDRFAADLAQAIDRLIGDPGLLREMGARSRERVEHFFSWKSVARWTMDFYWDLVQA